MKKFELDIDPDYDFCAVGIVCHAPDYRLCWAINQHLGWNLTFDESYTLQLMDKTEGQIAFHYYVHTTVYDHKIRLINNLSNHRNLVPEYKNFDHLLLIPEMDDTAVNELIKQLREIKLILLAHKIDVDSLPSKSNLLI